MTVLLTYGTHAKPFLPEIERIADFCEKEERDFRAPRLGRKANSIREMIRANKNVADRPQFTSIQELPRQQE